MTKKKMTFSTMFFVIILMMALTISTFAANVDFSGNLPAKQGDTEISQVARENDSTVKPYFTIKITSLGGNGDAVRAWTESIFEVNFSSPYNEAPLNESKNINYQRGPDTGIDVVLNLDNPVYTTNTVSVGGNWTPN